MSTGCLIIVCTLLATSRLWTLTPIPFYYFIESTKLIMHHVMYSGVITFFLSDWDLSRFKGRDFLLRIPLSGVSS